MFPLVEFPELVEHYAPFFDQVFSPEAFIEFKRYISGLIVSENKTIEGINRLFVHESRNQSSLNRLLNNSPFSLDTLDQKRLELLDSLPGTQMKPKGVFSLDDTFLAHYGHHFEQIAYLYDHSQDRRIWAHNLVSIHYSDDDTDYPLLCQLWKPVDLEKLEEGLLAAGVKLRESKLILKKTQPQKWRQYLIGVWRRNRKKKPGVVDLYDSKLRIAELLLQQWVQDHPDRKHPVTFDNWYTQPDFCRFLDKTLDLPYVGTLAANDQAILKSGAERLDVFAARLKEEHKKAVKEGGRLVFKPITIRFKEKREKYYSYCATHRIRNYGKHRLVINHRQADLSDKPKFLMSNRLIWQAPGITRIRRHRWPIEVYYEEGKAEGLDQYQLRGFEAIGRHVALVAVVYSLLRAAQHDHALRDKLQGQLKIELEGSVAFWRRATQARSLWSLALFIGAGLSQGQTLHQIMEPLLRSVCAT
jgi:hypothetical protein